MPKIASEDIQMNSTPSPGPQEQLEGERRLLERYARDRSPTVREELVERFMPLARRLAARTVNKNRARSGESKARSRTSTRGSSPSRRGGQRSGTNRPKGQTKEQLYNQAKRLNIEGRSSMNKSQLQRAVAAKRR